MNSIEDIKWVKVEGSSQIAKRSHDKKSSTLYLQFHNGSVYSYSDVSESDYEDFSEASSVGSHFHTYIKHLKTTKLKNKK